MTLNDLLRKAQALAMQMSSGDIPLDREIDLDLVEDGYGGYFVWVREVKEEEKSAREQKKKH